MRRGGAHEEPLSAPALSPASAPRANPGWRSGWKAAVAARSRRDTGRGSRCGALAVLRRNTRDREDPGWGRGRRKCAELGFPPKGRLGSGEGLAARPGMAELGSGSSPLPAV